MQNLIQSKIKNKKSNDLITSDLNGEINQILENDITNTNIILRQSFTLENSTLNYKIEINQKLINLLPEEIKSNEELIEAEVVPVLPLTLTERLFFQLGRNH